MSDLVEEKDFPTAEDTRPIIDVQEETYAPPQPVPQTKKRKFAQELMLSGDEWLEMSRAAKQVLDEEGDPVGALERVADEWEILGCSQQVLTWMREGVPILLEEEPRDHGGRGNYVKAEAMDFANEEISRLLFVMAIEPDPLGDSLEEGYVFPLGAVPKPHSDKFRLVTDITDRDRGPNAYMDKKSFKLEHVDDLLSQIGVGWYGIVFDLRAGFHHLLVKENDRKYLRFKWANQDFRFRAMPFGPRHSPFFFFKDHEGIRKDFEAGVYRAAVRPHVVSIQSSTTRGNRGVVRGRFCGSSTNERVGAPSEGRDYSTLDEETWFSEGTGQGLMGAQPKIRFSGFHLG